jgi:hypothetical protein
MRGAKKTTDPDDRRMFGNEDRLAWAAFHIWRDDRKNAAAALT